MPVLAVIPARLGATRLPRKPLRLLGGAPLVVRVYERVMTFALADRCIVATDDAEIMASCAAYNVPAVLTRSDHPSGTDRVAEVAAGTEFGAFDVIVNVQGDEPFVLREALVQSAAIVSSGQAAIGTAAVRASDEQLRCPDVVKVVRSDAGHALYFSRAPIPFLRDPSNAHEQQALALQHIGVYAYSPSALATWVTLPVHPLERIERLEQLRPLAHGMTIGVAEIVRVDLSGNDGGIDTEDDLLRANAHWMLRDL